MAISILCASSHPCPLADCLEHLSPSRVPRPPLAWGPWCWEGSAAGAHHPLRRDLHLAGAASGSPSVTAGEAEGIELGSPLGLLHTTVTEVPEQHVIICWEKFVCLCHYHLSVPYAGVPWMRTGASKDMWKPQRGKSTSHLPYQVTAIQQIPSTKHNYCLQVEQLNNGFLCTIYCFVVYPECFHVLIPGLNLHIWSCSLENTDLEESLLQTLFVPMSPLFRPCSFHGSPFATSAVWSSCSSTCCFLLPLAWHRVCLRALLQQQCFWRSVVDLGSAHVNILQRIEFFNFRPWTWL